MKTPLETGLKHIENVAATGSNATMWQDQAVAIAKHIHSLTAERDAARAVIWSAYANLHSHMFTTVQVDAPNKMVEAYETLRRAYNDIRRAALGSESSE